MTIDPADLDADLVEAADEPDPLAELIAGRRFVAQPWVRRAECRGETYLFFGDQGERPERAQVRERLALEYCDICLVRTPCREWAREHREFGIWGGETELDRAADGIAHTLAIGNVARLALQRRQETA